MSGREWFVERTGSSYGPVSWDEVVTWARQGRVAPGDGVRRAGEAVARPAGSIPGLLPTTAAPAAATATAVATKASAAGKLGVAGIAAIAAVVTVATLGIVLAVRGIGGSEPTGSPTVATTIQAGDEADGPAPEDPSDQATVLPAPDLTGQWLGRYELWDQNDEPNFFIPANRTLEFRVAPGTPDQTVQVMAQVPGFGNTPVLRETELTGLGEGAVITLVYQRAFSDGVVSVALSFQGRRVGDRFEGVVVATRFPDEARAQGTFWVERVGPWPSG